MPAEPDFIAAIHQLEGVAFAGEAYRHLAPGYSPRGAEGARIQGGRWNPPESFPVLYLALERESAVAEFYRRAEREAIPAENLLPRHIHRYRVELHEVLDLRDEPLLTEVGLSLAAVRSSDASTCQATGAAVHQAGFEGLLAPSATGIGNTLAVFTERLRSASFVDPIDFQVWESLPKK